MTGVKIVGITLGSCLLLAVSIFLVHWVVATWKQFSAQRRLRKANKTLPLVSIKGGKS